MTANRNGPAKAGPFVFLGNKEILANVDILDRGIGQGKGPRTSVDLDGNRHPDMPHIGIHAPVPPRLAKGQRDFQSCATARSEARRQNPDRILRIRPAQPQGPVRTANRADLGVLPVTQPVLCFPIRVVIPIPGAPPANPLAEVVGHFRHGVVAGTGRAILADGGRHPETVVVKSLGEGHDHGEAILDLVDRPVERHGLAGEHACDQLVVSRMGRVVVKRHGLRDDMQDSGAGHVDQIQGLDLLPGDKPQDHIVRIPGDGIPVESLLDGQYG